MKLTSRAQGAMEYLMTYGWAILVVMMVGLAMWRIGILNINTQTPPTYSGFGAIKPLIISCQYTGETPQSMQACAAATGNLHTCSGIFRCVFVNAGGTSIKIQWVNVSTNYNGVWNYGYTCKGRVNIGKTGNWVGGDPYVCRDRAWSRPCPNFVNGVMMCFNTKDWSRVDGVGYPLSPGESFFLQAGGCPPRTMDVLNGVCDSSYTGVVQAVGVPYVVNVDFEYLVTIGGKDVVKHTSGTIRGTTEMWTGFPVQSVF